MHVCVHMCVSLCACMVPCMWVSLCVGVHMYVCSGPHVRSSLSLNPELMDSASLAKPSCPWKPVFASWVPGYKWLPWLPSICVDSGVPNLSPYTWMEGALPAEPPPQPLYTFLRLKCLDSFGGYDGSVDRSLLWNLMSWVQSRGPASWRRATAPEGAFLLPPNAHCGPCTININI